MKRCIVLSFALIATCVVGCGSEDPVVSVDDSNVEMNKAIETARNTFAQFQKNWKTMPNDGASIKFGLPTKDGNVEHIWFEPIEITDETVKASCGNDPVNVDGLKLGDVRTFKRSEITDWMILSGARCYGAYTVRVLVKMDPENAPPLEFVDFE